MDAIVVVALVLLAVEFAVVAPLYAIMRYAAAIDRRYERYSRWLGALYLDETEKVRRNELTAAGGAGCLAFFAFFFGLLSLTVGGSPISGALIMLGCVSIWCGLIFEERYKSVAPRPPRGERTVALRCPNCGAVGFVKPGKIVRVRCHNCQATFRANSKPRALLSWLVSTALTAAWVVTTRPWQSGFIPPEWVLFTALVTLALAYLWQFLADLRRRETAARLIDFSALHELRIALVTIAAASFVFWRLNAYIDDLQTPGRNATVLWVQRSLHKTDVLLAFLEHWRVELWPSIFAIVIGLVLLRAHRVDCAKRVLARRKKAARALDWISRCALIISSFSLAGASSAGTVLKTAQFGLRNLDETVNRDLKSAAAALDRAAVTSAVAKALPPTIAWPVDCHAQDDQSSCTAKLLAAIDRESEHADGLNQRWADLGKAGPGATLADIQELRSELAVSGTGAEPSETITHIDRRAFESMTIGDLEMTAAAIDRASKLSAGPGSQERVEIAGIIVDVAFELLHLDANQFVKGSYGDMAAKLAESALGGPKKLFQEAVRNGLLRVSAACRGGASQCQRAADGAIVGIQKEFTAQPFIEAVANWSPSYARSTEATFLTLQQSNRASQVALNRFLASNPKDHDVTVSPEFGGSPAPTNLGPKISEGQARDRQPPNPHPPRPEAPRPFVRDAR